MIGPLRSKGSWVERKKTKHSTCTWMSILFNQMLMRFFLYQLYGYACGFSFLEVSMPKGFETCKCKSCQKKSPSFQLVKSAGFMNCSRAENIYIKTCDTSSNTTDMLYDFPTSKLRAIPLAKAVFTAGSGANVAALRTRSRSLPMNNRRLNFYPVNICSDVLDLLVGFFFPVVKPNAKRVSQNVGFPLEASWALPQIGWS